MVGFVQELQRRTPLGWLQLNRHKSRLLVAVSGIAFADILMFMQLGFQSALFDSNTRLNRSILADIVLVSSQAKNTQNLSTFSRRRLFDASDIPGVKTSEPMYIGMVTWRNPQTLKRATVQAIGFNPEVPALDIPAANAQLDKIQLPNSFLFDRGARGEYKKVFESVDAGKEVTTEVDRKTITISGLFKFGASFAADGILLSSEENFLRLFPRQKASSVNVGLIYLQPGYNPTQVATAIKAHLPNDVKVLTRAEFVELEEGNLRRESPIAFIFGFGVAMGFLIGVIIVYQILSTDVNAHLKEYATFKAMGYRNRYLLGVIFEEAIILACIGFIPGYLIPLGLYQLAANATNLPIYMPVARAILVFGLTIIMCTISGVIATNKLQSADPADMF
ncbi:ABC transporter [Dulcicalothrix desertica PCC 7102]|uniref:ABC transporter n=1 Tax=Dulcicalothrix desertica PCC 7102 TaxID=232991 RepID=A0A433V9P6_9CYAN|nr:ABC transporter permease DevC [Dulcicalothrix desertica]RUT02830.1 ABC transporter [Dulcicalothrix desertica PCC 7102]TWH38937.1 putative ABC transport system permease protein [Dulcicalothrix desertica PCC 7102]